LPSYAAHIKGVAPILLQKKRAKGFKNVSKVINNICLFFLKNSLINIMEHKIKFIKPINIAIMGLNHQRLDF
jgi:hypothetical protein